MNSLVTLGLLTLVAISSAQFQTISPLDDQEPPHVTFENALEVPPEAAEAQDLAIVPRSSQSNQHQPNFTINWSPSFNLRLVLSGSNLLHLMQHHLYNGSIIIDTSFNVSTDITIPGGVIGGVIGHDNCTTSTESPPTSTEVPPQPTTEPSTSQSTTVTPTEPPTRPPITDNSTTTETPTTSRPSTTTSQEPETTVSPTGTRDPITTTTPLPTTTTEGPSNNTDSPPPTTVTPTKLPTTVTPTEIPTKPPTTATPTDIPTTVTPLPTTQGPTNGTELPPTTTPSTETPTRPPTTSSTRPGPETTTDGPSTTEIPTRPPTTVNSTTDGPIITTDPITTTSQRPETTPLPTTQGSTNATESPPTTVTPPEIPTSPPTTVTPTPGPVTTTTTSQRPETTPTEPTVTFPPPTKPITPSTSSSTSGDRTTPDENTSKPSTTSSTSQPPFTETPTRPATTVTPTSTPVPTTVTTPLPTTQRPTNGTESPPTTVMPTDIPTRPPPTTVTSTPGPVTTTSQRPVTTPLPTTTQGPTNATESPPTTAPPPTETPTRRPTTVPTTQSPTPTTITTPLPTTQGPTNGTESPPTTVTPTDIPTRPPPTTVTPTPGPVTSTSQRPETTPTEPTVTFPPPTKPITPSTSSTSGDQSTPEDENTSKPSTTTSSTSQPPSTETPTRPPTTVTSTSSPITTSSTSPGPETTPLPTEDPPTTTQPTTTEEPTEPPITFPPIEIDPAAVIIENEYRRNSIVNMTSQAFDAYADAAWGADILQPLTLRPQGPRGPRQTASSVKNGHTIVSAMDTLLLMGLTSQYQRAKDWVQENLEVNAFNENSIADLYGALLANFALTSDRMFLTKAQQFADIYKRPLLVKLFFNKIYQAWSSKRLEFRYLADLSGRQKYWKDMEPIERYIDNVNDLEMFEKTLGQDLPIQLKSYLQAPRRRGADKVLSTYTGTIETMINDGYIASTPLLDLNYVTRKTASPPLKVHSHFSYCSYGAMFGLASAEQPDPDQKDFFLNIARGLAETCHLASNSSRTWLPFEEFDIDDSARNLNHAIHGQGGYALLSHLAESYFILYRLTREQKYRDYAWDLARSIQRHARTATGGYAKIANVNSPYAPKGNEQPPVFLGATLKFLYLTFSPIDYVPIDQWIFTPGGHPLPICGKNRAYPGGRCK